VKSYTSLQDICRQFLSNSLFSTRQTSTCIFKNEELPFVITSNN